MEIMVRHVEGIQPRGTVKAFRPSSIREAPEDYLFIFTPAEFQTFSEIYAALGEMARNAMNEERAAQVSATWSENPVLLSIADEFYSLGRESRKRFGLEDGYVIGSLTPTALGQDLYVVFLTRRKYSQRRGEEALEQFQSYPTGGPKASGN
jgi:hypothetical protein